jgi:hypothetical protein
MLTGYSFCPRANWPTLIDPPALFELRAAGSLRHRWLAEPKLRSREGWRPGLKDNSRLIATG